ncbi:YciI family protein [Sphingomonas sp. M1-B02]|uniref:YciI family protein n=1 Tax=Sphingomonas sp. M1-B02 TaxID=3114300 RepID=UPI00223ECFE4|nr:YciI family protein [Sphingomonas sp. S6-11]UZK67634.1 YciI family protein [Sphingomonas sp. S6-11]
MVIVLLDYVAEIAEVDRHRAAHVAWLKLALAEGRLVTAGRQVPLTGGVLIAKGTRAEVEAWAATDPFVTEGVATASFVEYTPSLAAPGLDALLA